MNRKKNDVDEEDYYAFLNIKRDASSEQIANAYRRLSRIYHPDKHLDSKWKKEAEILFSKTKKAYEVLKNPHTRAIYDNLGVKGLQIEGWEIVHTTKTPQQIREEYKRLAREQEDWRVQQCTNPKSSVSMSINASDLFANAEDRITYDYRDYFGFPHIEISNLAVSQSIEAPLSTGNTAFMYGEVRSSNGNGTGTINTSLRRVFSEYSWGEMGIGAGNGLTFNLKGFRTLGYGFVLDGTTQIGFSPKVIGSVSSVTLMNQLSTDLVGYLTWRLGNPGSLSTALVRESNAMRAEVALALSPADSHATFKLMLKSPTKMFLEVGLGVLSMEFKYGIRLNVSRHSDVTAYMSVGVPTGVELKISLKRATQAYTVRVLLCEDIAPAPIIYGTVLPIVGWMALKKLIIQPYVKKKRQKEMQAQREANRVRLAEKRREAAATTELMQETVSRIVDQEESVKGLVLIEALFGRLVSEDDDFSSDLDGEDKDVIEVTVPLQCLVKDSKLILHGSSKSALAGFFDPCPGESKVLRVKYLFRAVAHMVTVADDQPLKIPMMSHRTDA